VANRFRGDVDLTVDGRLYRFRFGANELCDLQDRLGHGSMEELAKSFSPAGMGLKQLRAVMHAGLKRHQPALTELEAGDLIDAMGGFVPALERVSEVLAAAFPEPKGSGEGGDPNAEGAGGSGTNS